MLRRFVFIAAAAAPALLSFAVRGPLHADARASQSLTSLVGPQSLVRDTNGDGLADAVAARIVVPAAPSLADVETAVNLAARGRVVYRASFSPKTVEREYLEKFPGWSRVVVT